MLYRGGENVYSDVIPDLKVTDFVEINSVCFGTYISFV